MTNGGYKIIDLQGTDFTSGTATTVPGVYEAIEDSYRKPLLISNFSIGGVERPDGFIIFSVKNGEGNYAGDYGDVTLLITAENNVTMTVKEGEQ